MDNFPKVCKSAEDAGLRRKGLKLFTQKPHGFSNERLANTDRISKFLKFAWQYWENNRAWRFAMKADLDKRQEKLRREREKWRV